MRLKILAKECLTLLNFSYILVDVRDAEEYNQVVSSTAAQASSKEKDMKAERSHP
jgi:hypothetical protein